MRSGHGRRLNEPRPGAARSRVADLTERFKRASSTVWCGFSVGIAELAPGGQPEPALQLADQNMYQAKNQKRR